MMYGSRLERVGSKRRPFTQNNKRYFWYTPDSYPEEIFFAIEQF